jgi:hypothetical protein
MSLFIPRIAFFPRQLAEVKERILKEIPEYPIDERAVRRADGVDFEALLIRLRRTPADSVVRVAEDLSLAEVDALSYRFPEIAPQDSAKRRATTVLMARWRRRYGQMAWRQFQRSFNDPELPRLVNMALEKQQLSLSSSAVRRLSIAMSAEDPVGKMADSVQFAEVPFDRDIEELNIIRGTPLYKELLERYFVDATAAVYRKRETEYFILDSWMMLAAERAESYPLVIDRYLTILNPGEFRTGIMNHIFSRLGRPDAQGNTQWQRVSSEAQARYLRWLNMSVMRKFFEEIGDNERFQFWARFEDLLRDVRPIVVRRSKVVFLVLDGAVVVEFAKTGNAAYVYSPSRYERDFQDYATGRKQVAHESALKDTLGSWTLTDAMIYGRGETIFDQQPNTCLRIIHSGSWQDRIYGVMRLIAKKR